MNAPTTGPYPQTRSHWLIAMIFLAAAARGAEVPAPLDNPIPDRIRLGDIVVHAEKFVRAPQTADAYRGDTRLQGIGPLGTSTAFARLQHMKPVPDGSGRVAVSDLRGVLYLTPTDQPELVPFLDLRRDAPDFAHWTFPNEAGLLGFAFHPDFANAGTPGYGKLYTAYSVTADSGQAIYLEDDESTQDSVIREWNVTDVTAGRFAGTTREVFRVGQFAQNHNIGNLAFNPAARRGSADFGALYFSLGDGGGAMDPYRHGQNRRSPLAAILRINPTGPSGRQRGHHAYHIPSDNPFLSMEDSIPEMWAYGLRHAQHFSFSADGTMFINDIGQMHIEEVNLGRAGGNYGWSVREGSFTPGFSLEGGYAASIYPPQGIGPEVIDPVAQYDHDEGFAIGSGYPYTGSIAALQGKYVFADIVNGRIFYFQINEIGGDSKPQVRALQVRVDGRRKSMIDALGYANTYAPGTRRVDLRLGIDSTGELYLLTKGDGWIRKLVARRR